MVSLQLSIRRKGEANLAGVFPDVGLKEARERRDEQRRLVAQGIDPSAKRKAAKASRYANATNSFEHVAREWLATKAPGWSEVHTAPLFGDRLCLAQPPPRPLRERITL